MTRPSADVLTAFAALPVGTFTGESGGKSYSVSRSQFANGASEKLVAHELGGSDYISANLYHLGTGPRLFPCEMPYEKVATFVTTLKPE